MISLDFKALEEMLEGRLLNRKFEENRFKGVSIDTRTIEPDELFIAIKGKNHDGHKYLGNAIEKKCGGLLVANDYAPAWEHQGKVPIIIVNNTHDAMIRMATKWREDLKAKVIGITGSNGKTTTKEITAAILKENTAAVYKSPGNYNNLYGLPLAIFEMPEDSEYAVLEMGISLKGEMTRLAGIANPDLVVITNVGPAHLETLGSVEGVAEAKLELVDAVDKDVPVILNADDPVLMKAARERQREYLTFGFENDADFKGRLSGMGPKGNPVVFIEGRRISLRLFGTHQAYNLLAAYAIVRTLGIDFTPDRLNDIDFASDLYRGEIEHLENLTVVADCYNANPGSMKSGLKSFRQYLKMHHDEDSRGVVIIGDMLELGEESEKYHTEIGRLLKELDFELVITVGKESETIYNIAREASVDEDKIIHFADVSLAGNDLADCIKHNDVIYLKASRGIGLEKLITILKGTALRQN